MKDKLAYDFFYIKNFSLWLDLLILQDHQDGIDGFWLPLTHANPVYRPADISPPS